jgi:hypothetical protein
VKSRKSSAGFHVEGSVTLELHKLAHSQSQAVMKDLLFTNNGKSTGVTAHVSITCCSVEDVSLTN